MHLIEGCLPSAAASFLGQERKRPFSLSGEKKPLSQLKENPKPLNVKLFLAFGFVTHQV